MKHLLLLAIITLPLLGYGQPKNSLKVLSGNVYFPQYNLFNPGIFTQYGLSYERNLTAKKSIGISVMRWGVKGGALGASVSLRARKSYYVDLKNAQRQDKYKFYSLFFNYAILNKKYHTLSISPELSVAHGYDAYVKRAEYFYEFGYPHLSYVEFLVLHQKHLGGSLGLSYQVKLLKEHLLLGINGKISYYPKAFLQMNYGLQAGFAF
jgi:hypothetical protein